MSVRVCSDVQAWLLQSADATGATQPDLDIAEHVQGCARCRAALVLLVGALVGEPPDAMPMRCDAYEDRLPVFAEREALHGTVAAARQMPDVWWHLLICEECAAVHELMVAAMAAERAGDLPLPLLTPEGPPTMTRLLTLARPLLNLALAPALQLGHVRGEDDEPDVIFEKPAESGATITVSVRDQPSGHWSVIVQIDPPLNGTLVLTLGDATFRAAIDDQGTATVGRVPAELLAASGGPNLIVGVELLR